ncbi:MAG: hypothetical protein K9G26_07520 [Emcibacter sp.]|nr:hypothetical protein [Emcibacter sp.]
MILITESLISDKDIFFKKSDDEFIIVFASTTDERAKLISAKILQKLTEKFIGSVETKDIIVKTAVNKVDGAIMFQSEDLQCILNHSQNEIVNRHLHDFQNINSPVDTLKEEPFLFGYRPVWDSIHEVITTFIVKPCVYTSRNINNNSRPKKIGYDVLEDPDSKQARIDLDLLTLTSSIETLEELYQNNFRSIFNISICYETVFNIELLMEYISHCKNISPSLKKYIVFHLVDFPEGIPTPKLHFIVSTLKKYSSAVMLLTSTSSLHLEKYFDCGIKVIGTNILDHGPSTEKTWQKIALFIENCHKYKIKVALLDVNTLEDLIIAQTKGVDYISGLTIGDYKDTSWHMKRKPWKNFLK